MPSLRSAAGPLALVELAVSAQWSEAGVPADAILLRIFVGEEDRYAGQSLYEAIVSRALQQRMAGATVLPCPLGFGRSRHVRSDLHVDEGPRRPMVVEIVDSEARIEGFLPLVDEMIESGLVTLERVRAIRYRRRQSAAAARDDPAPSPPRR